MTDIPRITPRVSGVLETSLSVADLERAEHVYRTGISRYVRDPDGHALQVACPGLWPNS